MEFLAGTDNLHFKRKQRNLNALKRKKAHRQSYEAILIVCEGTQTEPNYLKGLRADLKLNPANVVIKPCERGTDPLNVVNFALEEHKREGYDRLYCVFDKDQHPNYQKALDKINREKQVHIYAITSVPCFEYWLLLHYEETTQPFSVKGHKSAGDQLKSVLKKYIHNYHETPKNIFDLTKHNLTTALSRAKQIDVIQTKNGTDNPSTKFYQLVEYLQSIQR